MNPFTDRGPNPADLVLTAGEREARAKQAPAVSTDGNALAYYSHAKTGSPATAAFKADLLSAAKKQTSGQIARFEKR